ncbi:ComEC/Rec2 family competence protein [Nitrospirillum pindoramense]|uniref:Beta-lactamase superfamily II metal-dependent hydrolase n=1 Tax=Nitrospirillum amazonense TaxID=28077 RepID=A0A560GS98_9PROT|nr:MBL fold metallo-hydrolase [Nitrospirillum amazonense]TWB36519.1 beta-lactamase superfamily II metal-dependent hydrolase [Nitrospirillum amazonense]
MRGLIARRQFCGGLAGGLLLAATGTARAADGGLPPWTPGTLDIHHIDTGRGNATFILGPDGTTLLIDCGTTREAPGLIAPCRPDATRQPGEWVARYALRQARAAGRDSLDYMVATHIHPDHVGDTAPDLPRAPDGDYQVTGLSQVDRYMPATLVIDRAYPDYGALPPLNAPFAANYRAWLDARVRGGRGVAAARVGSVEQIRPRTPGAGFAIRVLAGNGRVWTGQGQDSRSLFPDSATLGPGERPVENMMSLALRLDYGRFGYFTGGDLTASTHDGLLPWMDVETPTVTACGRVEVAVADHHGYFDACGPEFVRRLDPQAFVIPSWHVTHPGMAQMERLTNAWPGAKPRDVFATELLPAAAQINERFLPALRSRQGHVVVRVAPGGDSYRIFVLDSTREEGGITLACGPYACRG